MDRSTKTPLALAALVALPLAIALILEVRSARLFFLPAAAPAATSEPVQSGLWYGIYFTDPGQESLRGGPAAPLIAAIGTARLTIDMAVYDLDLWSLRDALIAAHRRGVRVRVVAEKDNFENLEMRALLDAGIPIVTDNSDALMHNKFVVIDHQQVWSGSMNFTLNGAYRNDNNLFSLRHPAIAAAYQAEFEELFAGRFGGGRRTEQQEFEIDGTWVEIWFSPEDGTARRLQHLLAEAEESILFLAFSFTSDDFAETIDLQARSGLQVQGVFDESQAGGQGSEFEKMLSSGLDVYLDGNPNKMHHKVIIIDRKIVVTGSYNFSRSAETRNDENLVIFFSPEIAALFLGEFSRVLEAAR